MISLLLSILLLLLPVFSSPAYSQVSSNTAHHIFWGASLPSACNPNTGDVFTRTFDHTYWMCTAINTWTQINSGSGTGTVTEVDTTSPITGGPITTTGNIACATCVTSATSLANNAIMTGAGSQGSKTSSALATVDASGNLVATTFNKMAITAPATSSTLAVADGKTLTASNTLTFTGTDSSSVVFGTGGTVAYTNVATLSSLASIGTITTGTWNGSVVGTTYGGLGAALNAAAAHSTIISNGATPAVYSAKVIPDCVDAGGNHLNYTQSTDAFSCGTTISATGFSALTDGATVTWAIASAATANAALTFTVHGGSRTLNITGPVSGGSYVLKLVQDSTGGEGLTLGTGCTWKVSNGGAGAITPSTGANAIDVLAFTYDGTNCLANFNTNFN